MSAWIEDNGSGEFDVQGFVSPAGHALGECLDAAGIDWRIEVPGPQGCNDGDAAALRTRSA
jgi:hypothetical protein